MKKIIFLIGIAFFIISCEKDAKKEELVIPEYLANEVYDVYGSILYTLSSINIVVSTTDTSLNCADFLKMGIDTIGVTSEIVEQCIALNSKEYAFEEEKLLSGGLRLVSWDEISNAESSLEIYGKYGANGMYRFGVPVFYNSGNSAMFELDRNCGALCGNGAIIIAKKVNDSWGVEYFYATWISK